MVFRKILSARQMYSLYLRGGNEWKLLSDREKEKLVKYIRKQEENEKAQTKY